MFSPKDYDNQITEEVKLIAIVTATLMTAGTYDRGIAIIEACKIIDLAKQKNEVRYEQAYMEHERFNKGR